MSLENFTKHILPIKQKLFRFSLRIVENRQEAEDVVQEVFIKMWNRRSEWHKYQNIEAWCMQMTKNLSIDKLRSKHQKTAAISAGLPLYSTEAAPDKRAELKDLTNRIKQLINTLPEKQKMVFHLRDVEGLTYQEIADHLNLPISQVRVYIYRARQSIKSQLINIDTYGL